MPECDYCEESFDSEGEYHAHLAAEHEGELGPIDRRKIGAAGGSEREIPTGPLVLGGLVVAALALTVWVVVAFGGDGHRAPDIEGTITPGPLHSAHSHGTINVTIDGERVDFSRQEYQLEADKFHFEGDNGRIWHTHATDVTVEWAMATLGIGLTNDSVTYEGTTYTDGNGTEVRIEVNGEPVDPTSSVLDGVPDGGNAENGDHVHIVVRTSS